MSLALGKFFTNVRWKATGHIKTYKSRGLKRKKEWEESLKEKERERKRLLTNVKNFCLLYVSHPLSVSGYFTPTHSQTSQFTDVLYKLTEFHCYRSPTFHHQINHTATVCLFRLVSFRFVSSFSRFFFISFPLFSLSYLHSNTLSASSVNLCGECEIEKLHSAKNNHTRSIFRWWKDSSFFLLRINIYCLLLLTKYPASWGYDWDEQLSYDAPRIIFPIVPSLLLLLPLFSIETGKHSTRQTDTKWNSFFFFLSHVTWVLVRQTITTGKTCFTSLSNSWTCSVFCFTHFLWCTRHGSIWFLWTRGIRKNMKRPTALNDEKYTRVCNA